jgi:hypothetical protein
MVSVYIPREENITTFKEVIVGNISPGPSFHLGVIILSGWIWMEIDLETRANEVKLALAFFGIIQHVLTLTKAVHVVINHRLQQFLS